MSKSRLEKTAVSISVIAPLLGTFYAIYLLWGGWVGWREIAILVGMHGDVAVGIGAEVSESPPAHVVELLGVLDGPG